MRYTGIVLGLAMAFGSAGLVGCDETISHEEEVDVKRDGTIKREEETIKRQPDGTIVKEEKEEVERPNNR